MMDIKQRLFSNIRGGLIGLVGAGIILFLIWFVAFMVAFGNPGPIAGVYLAVAGFLLSGFMPILILLAGYLVGAVGIGR